MLFNMRTSLILAVFFCMSIVTVYTSENAFCINTSKDSKAIDCDVGGSQCLCCRGGQYCPAAAPTTTSTPIYSTTPSPATTVPLKVSHAVNPLTASFIGCPLGTVCDPNSLPECVDVATLPTNKCGCSSSDIGSYRDFYNPHLYYTCNSTIVEYFACPDDQYFTESESRCFALSKCEANGCFSIVEECGVYYCCQLDPDTGFFEQTFSKCASPDEVFDYTIGNCIDPRFNCTGKLDGFYKDPVKCDIAHLCNNGGLEQSKCCDLHEVYSAEINRCVPKENACGFITICYDDFWETTTCDNKCVNAGEVFASHNPCTKYYYECEANAAGVIFPSAKECLSDLIFNPSTLACDDNVNVTDC